jgi:hypothetical protein
MEGVRGHKTSYRELMRVVGVVTAKVVAARVVAARAVVTRF